MVSSFLCTAQADLLLRYFKRLQTPFRLYTETKRITMIKLCISFAFSPKKHPGKAFICQVFSEKKNVLTYLVSIH